MKYFSPSTKGFYPAEFLDRYQSVGTLPDDLIEIDEESESLFRRYISENKSVAVVDGELIWAEPSISIDELVSQYERAVQQHLDETAKGYGYDDIKSAVTYADEPAVPRFQIEGLAFRAWRSLCWDYCYSLLAEVQAGATPLPVLEEVLAGLPALEVSYGN